MERPLMTTHDAITGTTEIREMTDEEIAEYAYREPTPEPEPTPEEETPEE